MAKRNNRPDHHGPQRVAYEKNRRRVLATQTVCGICGKPVDKTLPHSHPQSAVVDHILPISKGGHPSALDNLQLSHKCCNEWKGAKVTPAPKQTAPEVISNRILPLSRDWINYREGDDE